MYYTNYTNYTQRLDEEDPMSFPVMQDYPLNYSIAMQIQRVAVNAAAIIYWISRISNTTNIFEIIICVIMAGGCIYSLIVPMIERVPLIKIYSPQKII